MSSYSNVKSVKDKKNTRPSLCDHVYITSLISKLSKHSIIQHSLQHNIWFAEGVPMVTQGKH